jgi:large subunit ribosomal protein L24
MQETKRIKNPKKQRKKLFNAPAHIRHKLMAAHLSSEISASRGVKTLPVRKGDTVRIERGDHKGFEGKVSRIDSKHYRVFLEGLTREKVDGTNIFVSVHPSKIQIRNLNLDDKRRKDILGRKKIEKPGREEKTKTKPLKKAEMPTTKVEEVEEEKLEEVPPIEEEQAPAEVLEVEKVSEKAPAAKKAVVKKPAVKKETPVVEEKEPAKKAVAKPKIAKKTIEPKETPVKQTAEKKSASKSRAKSKSEEGEE